MTHIFDEQMFEFFSTEETFTDMYTIADQLPNVKVRLIEEFWSDVVDELKRLSASVNNKWKIIRVEPIKSKISKLMVYKENWGMVVTENCPQLAISYERLDERPFYGPFIHNRANGLDHASGHKHLRDFDFGESFERDSSSFYPFYNFLNPSLVGLDDFISILPANRHNTTKTTADTIFHLAEKLEVQMDYVNDHFRK